MDQQQPTPPNELKPWYYQYWFLYPVIVFWPLWPVLILRSPWHNNLISGAVAWAMIFVGGYLIGWQIGWYQLRLSQLNDFTITILIPGVILTVVTQVLWLRDKKIVRQAAKSGGPLAGLTAPAPPRRPRSRRRGSRPGRSGRGR
jgi:hypothetical protein